MRQDQCQGITLKGAKSSRAAAPGVYLDSPRDSGNGKMISGSVELYAGDDIGGVADIGGVIECGDRDETRKPSELGETVAKRLHSL